jgi:hypothetical protein
MDGMHRLHRSHVIDEGRLLVVQLDDEVRISARRFRANDRAGELQVETVELETSVN